VRSSDLNLENYFGLRVDGRCSPIQHLVLIMFLRVIVAVINCSKRIIDTRVGAMLFDELGKMSLPRASHRVDSCRSCLNQ
jgi:hypothetical protein